MDGMEMTPEVLKLLDRVSQHRSDDGSLTVGGKVFRTIQPTQDGTGIEFWTAANGKGAPNYRIYNPPIADYESRDLDPILIIKDTLGGESR